MKKRHTFISAAAILAIAMGCGEKVSPGRVEVARKAVTGVTTAVVSTETVDEYREFSGTVRAKNVQVVASRMMGIVMAVLVKEGDRVAPGTLLVRIDDRDMTERVRAAEHAAAAAGQQRELARVTAERYRTLYQEKAVSRQEMDQIETQQQLAESEHDRAQAMLGETRVNLGFARITSSVSGIVISKKISAGSMAVPGMPLIEIEDTSAFHIEAYIDERYSDQIRKGTSVAVAFPSLGRDLQATVSEVVPSVDPRTRSFTVKVNLSAEGLRNGAYGVVRVAVGRKEGIFVPSRAVVARGQLTGVYAVDGQGVMTFRLIRTGKKYGDRIEILSGLASGDTIVVDGIENASDGGRVTVP